jgi:ABC-type sugar transport system substrate-binding protein
MHRLIMSRATAAIASLLACMVVLISAAAAQAEPAAQALSTPTPVVRVGGAVGVTNLQPGATPTVRAVGVVSVTQTTAPRAGGLPLEFVPPLIGGAVAAISGGVLLLRRRSGPTD